MSHAIVWDDKKVRIYTDLKKAQQESSKPNKVIKYFKSRSQANQFMKHLKNAMEEDEESTEHKAVTPSPGRKRGSRSSTSRQHSRKKRKDVLYDSDEDEEPTSGVVSDKKQKSKNIKNKNVKKKKHKAKVKREDTDSESSSAKSSDTGSNIQTTDMNYKQLADTLKKNLMKTQGNKINMFYKAFPTHNTIIASLDITRVRTVAGEVETRVSKTDNNTCQKHRNSQTIALPNHC